MKRMTCKDCVFATPRTAFFRCQNHGLDTTENAVICNEFKRRQQTNADLIRHMNNEELADLFFVSDCCCCVLDYYNACKPGMNCGTNCRTKILEWLKRERDDDRMDDD